MTNDVIIDAFVKLTGLPELFLRDEVALQENDVLAFFQSEVIGQEEACQAATGTVLTFKAGLNDPSRPLSVLFFTGPTGVGKTELARSLGAFSIWCGGRLGTLRAVGHERILFAGECGTFGLRFVWRNERVYQSHATTAVCGCVAGRSGKSSTKACLMSC